MKFTTTITAASSVLHEISLHKIVNVSLVMTTCCRNVTMVPVAAIQMSGTERKCLDRARRCACAGGHHWVGLHGRALLVLVHKLVNLKASACRQRGGKVQVRALEAWLC